VEAVGVGGRRVEVVLKGVKWPVRPPVQTWEIINLRNLLTPVVGTYEVRFSLLLLLITGSDFHAREACDRVGAAVTSATSCRRGMGWRPARTTPGLSFHSRSTTTEGEQGCGRWYIRGRADRLSTCPAAAPPDALMQPS
jgi:hypothetical protein